MTSRSLFFLISFLVISFLSQSCGGSNEAIAVVKKPTESNLQSLQTDSIISQQAAFSDSTSAYSTSPNSISTYSTTALSSNHLVDIFTTPNAWVDSTLMHMTVEEKVGQLITAFSFSYYQSNDDEGFEKISKLVREGKIGGVMFSRGDIYSVAMLSNRFQSQAKYPLWISADMEWGVSMRIERTTEFPNAMAVAATRNSDYSFKMAQVIAKEARALGIHQNFAPDVDLNSNPQNPVINTRSFGENKEIVTQFASAFINGTQSSGMMATAKHFPGHGDTETDSHKDLPVLPFTMDRLNHVELPPFKAAIDSGVMSVMIAHLALPEVVGSEKIPSTLSEKITTDLLQNKLGFKGLIVTDGMTMEGVKKNYSVESATVKAILAGNDMILLSPDYEEAYKALLDAAKNGTISEERLNHSVRKILAAKGWMNLEKNRFIDIEQISAKVGLKSSLALAQEIADHSITLLKNDKATLPIDTTPKKSRARLVNISLQNSAKSEVGSGFYTSFQKQFPNSIRFQLDAKSNSQNYSTAMNAANRALAVVVACYADTRAWEGKYGMDKTQEKFLRTLAAKLKKKKIPLILVSFGTPYLIIQFPDVPVYMCAYSSSKVSEIAASKVLKGTITPQGKLPITIPGLFQFGDGINFTGNRVSKK